MPNHDIPQDPGCAAVLENDIVQTESVVQKGDLFMLDDCGVAVDETFGHACCAAGVQDVQWVREGNSRELERLVGGSSKEGV